MSAVAQAKEKMTRGTVGQFAFFFAVQFIQYGLACWNWRMIAAGHLAWIGVSDMAFAGVNFLIIKKVAKAETYTAWAGFMIGGAIGSVVSVWLTILIYGGAK